MIVSINSYLKSAAGHGEKEDPGSIVIILCFTMIVDLANLEYEATKRKILN